MKVINMCGRMRKKYDPRQILVALEERNSAAQAAAKEFKEALTEGKLELPATASAQGAHTEAAGEELQK